MQRTHRAHYHHSRTIEMISGSLWKNILLFSIPLVLTKHAEDFLWAAEVIRDLGYREINLNIGCPSGTVVAKGKGSGMLRELDELARFFDSVFAASPLPISVKTRIGLETEEEFVRILELYNQYPIQELTIPGSAISPRPIITAFRPGYSFRNASISDRVRMSPLKHKGSLLCFTA